MCVFFSHLSYHRICRVDDGIFSIFQFSFMSDCIEFSLRSLTTSSACVRRRLDVFRQPTANSPTHTQPRVLFILRSRFDGKFNSIFCVFSQQSFAFAVFDLVVASNRRFLYLASTGKKHKKQQNFVISDYYLFIRRIAMPYNQWRTNNPDIISRSVGLSNVVNHRQRHRMFSRSFRIIQITSCAAHFSFFRFSAPAIDTDNRSNIVKAEHTTTTKNKRKTFLMPTFANERKTKFHHLFNFCVSH